MQYLVQPLTSFTFHSFSACLKQMSAECLFQCCETLCSIFGQPVWASVKSISQSSWTNAADVLLCWEWYNEESFNACHSSLNLIPPAEISCSEGSTSDEHDNCQDFWLLKQSPNSMYGGLQKSGKVEFLSGSPYCLFFASYLFEILAFFSDTQALWYCPRRSVMFWRPEDWEADQNFALNSFFLWERKTLFRERFNMFKKLQHTSHLLSFLFCFACRWCNLTFHLSMFSFLTKAIDPVHIMAFSRILQ